MAFDILMAVKLLGYNTCSLADRFQYLRIKIMGATLSSETVVPIHTLHNISSHKFTI
jgi:hypothetical protein